MYNNDEVRNYHDWCINIAKRWLAVVCIMDYTHTHMLTTHILTTHTYKHTYIYTHADHTHTHHSHIQTHLHIHTCSQYMLTRCTHTYKQWHPFAPHAHSHTPASTYTDEKGRNDKSLMMHSTHFIQTYGKEPDSKRGNLLLAPHGLLLSISSKGSFICTIPQTGKHITQLLLHQSWSTGCNKQ